MHKVYSHLTYLHPYMYIVDLGTCISLKKDTFNSKCCNFIRMLWCIGL